MQGQGERKVVKGNLSIDVHFTPPLMRDAVWSHSNSTVRRRMMGQVAFPNRCIREAEYQETVGRFSDLYRRRFCTFHHVLHRACSTPISRFYVALMLIRVALQPWYLGCIFRNRGLLQTTCTNVPSLLNLESFACTPFVGRARSSSRA